MTRREIYSEVGRVAVLAAFLLLTFCSCEWYRSLSVQTERQRAARIAHEEDQLRTLQRLDSWRRLRRR